MVDFQSDLRNEILRWLPHDKSDPELKTELAGMSTGSLLIWFLNWLGRWVHPQPRQVFVSSRLASRVLPSMNRMNLDCVIEKIKSGADVTPHLSRGIKHGIAKAEASGPTKNLSKRPHLDLLLNDWSIHHLHLSDVFSHDGFVRRNPKIDGDLLLFAIFRPGSAYLLDVLPHGEWTNEGLVEAAIQSWPSMRFFVPLNCMDINGTSRADRQRLRAAGIVCPVVIGGRTFINPLGMSTAGTTSHAVHWAGGILRILASRQAEMERNPEHLRPEVEKVGRDYPAAPSFRLKFIRYQLGWGFAALEEISEVMIPIVWWPA